jgi:hypothetical protein
VGIDVLAVALPPPPHPPGKVHQEAKLRRISQQHWYIQDWCAVCRKSHHHLNPFLHVLPFLSSKFLLPVLAAAALRLQCQTCAAAVPE